MKQDHSFLPKKAAKEADGVGVSNRGFRFPGPHDRVTLNGMTGSGKTTFAMWLFAESADFDKKPWIMLDYKIETMFTQALNKRYFRKLAIGADIPDKPGVFVVRPDLSKGQQPVKDLLWGIYRAGHCGLFLDEATMVPELRGEANSGGPFQSILSQGRSKEIPCWVLAQRPAFVNNMVYTENNYYCAFRLRSEDDLKKVNKNIPDNSENYDAVWSADRTLKPHWSRWYDVEQDKSWILRPCPPSEEILKILGERLDMRKNKQMI